MTETKRLSDHVMDVVSEYVSHVFVLPGGFSQSLNDALNFHPKLKPVFCLHEAAAGFAAIGYAQYTGGLGVCLVTSGPGCTNVLTAVASAYQDSVPLLILSGEAKVENIMKRRKWQLRQGGAQDVEIGEIAKPITKAVFVNTSGLGSLVSVAIEKALKPRRGPVWLAFPLDVQGMEV